MSSTIGVYPSVNVAATPDITGKVCAGSFQMVAYNQILNSYTVSGGIELSLDSGYANKVIEILGVLLFRSSVADSPPGYRLIVVPGILPTQTANQAPNVSSYYQTSNRSNTFGVDSIVNGSVSGQAYRWGIDDIGGAIQLGATPKVSILFIHTALITYTDSNAGDYVSLYYR
jgi:hypothetical protein